MSIYINPSHQMAGIWCGVAFFFCFLAGLGIAAPFIPPVSPADTAAEMAQIFRENAWRIKLGCILIIVGSVCISVFYLTIACLQIRMAKGFPFLAAVQLINGTATFVYFLLTPMIWALIAFRPELPGTVLQPLNDLAWFGYFFLTATAMTQSLTIGLSVLQDYHSPPILPRWYGFLNLWIALLFLPAFMVPYFKAGPFAWDGLVNFWVVLVAFCLWCIATFFCGFRAIKAQQDELSDPVELAH